MRQKPKTSLSTLQQKRLFRIVFGLAILVLGWVIFAPGRGFYHLHRQSAYLLELEEKSKTLVQESSDMARDIDRLTSDKEYLEQVAREKHGMLKDNEMVFDFSKKKK